VFDREAVIAAADAAGISMIGSCADGEG